MANQKRAALYLRVSTSGQTTETQRRELIEAAAYKGWTVVTEFEDAGVSGTKGRDQRPGFDAMLKAAALQRKKFDVIMVWSVDRLSRSLKHLVDALTHIHKSHVDLYLHKQNVDTTTPMGKAMFQICGVFAELEHEIIVDRVRAGFARVKATGITKTGIMPGRPKVSAKIEAEIRARLANKDGKLKIGRELGVGTKVVQRIAAEMKAAR